MYYTTLNFPYWQGILSYLWICLSFSEWTLKHSRSTLKSTNIFIVTDKMDLRPVLKDFERRGGGVDLDENMLVRLGKYTSDKDTG